MSEEALQNRVETLEAELAAAREECRAAEEGIEALSEANRSWAEVWGWAKIFARRVREAEEAQAKAQKVIRAETIKEAMQAGRVRLPSAEVSEPRVVVLKDDDFIVNVAEDVRCADCGLRPHGGVGYAVRGLPPLRCARCHNAHRKPKKPRREERRDGSGRPPSV